MSVFVNVVWQNFSEAPMRLIAMSTALFTGMFVNKSSMSKLANLSSLLRFTFEILSMNFVVFGTVFSIVSLNCWIRENANLDAESSPLCSGPMRSLPRSSRCFSCTITIWIECVVSQELDDVRCRDETGMERSGACSPGNRFKGF